MTTMTMEQLRRSEKQEEADCDALVRSMLGTVRRYSQPRASKQTPGIADREYVIFGTVLRWEVKAEDGKLTQEQYDLLKEDYQSMRHVGCGTVDDLALVLQVARKDLALSRPVGWRLVELWAARGLRRKRGAA